MPKSNIVQMLSTLPTTVTMTLAQWAAVPDNPRQRNTERHLKRAIHLLTPSSAHKFVNMAITSEGQSFKLDGHTRSALWTQQPVLAPEKIVVLCHYVDSIDDVKELYTHFDSQVAVETAADRTSGALHEAGWQPASPLLRKGNLIFSLRIAEQLAGTSYKECAVLTIYDLLPRWQVELELLDSVGPTSGRFNAAVIVAALLSLRRWQSRALPFWQAFVADQGTKLETEIDAIEALSRLLASERTAGGRSRVIALASRVISCFESWRTKHAYSVGGRSRSGRIIGLNIKSTNLDVYLHKQKTGISQ